MTTTAFDDLPPATDSTDDEIPAPKDDADEQRAYYMTLDAPYGRFKNGKPRKNPPKGQSAGRSSKKSQTYAAGIADIFSMVGTGLAIAGAAKPVFLADAIAVQTHGPQIARALDQIAQEKPEVAAVLERLLSAGPYALLAAAVIPLFMQIGANHGVLPPGMFGTAKPDDLIQVAMKDFEPEMAMSTNGAASAR